MSTHSTFWTCGQLCKLKLRKKYWVCQCNNFVVVAVIVLNIEESAVVMSYQATIFMQNDQSTGAIEVIGGDNLEDLEGKVSNAVIVVHVTKSHLCLN